MTATFVTNPQTTTQILFANDQILVAETGTVFVTNGSAIETNLSNTYHTETVIDGTVATITDFTISLTGSVNGTPEGSGIHSLIIGTTGVVRNIGANLGAIYLEGSNNSVVNYGSVFSNGKGVDFHTGADQYIENHGIIHSTTKAAINILPYGVHHVVNTGTLSGHDGIKAFLGGLDFVNYGTVIADKGSAVFSGASTFDSKIVNSGTLQSSGNAIFLGNGSDSVRNTGLIIGNVTLNNGNDSFNGRGGTMEGTVFGGAGSDTYTVSDPGANLHENASEGVDSVNSYVNWRLGANFENLTLMGNAVSGVGNSLGNTVYGNQGDNRLLGADGNDALYGKEGNDTLNGGIGNDFLSGGEGNDILRGRSGNDNLNGDYGDDVLRGNWGNDALAGNRGDDLMAGGKGNDTYRFHFTLDGQDVIHEIRNGFDTLYITGGRVLSQLDFRRSGEQLVIESGGTTDRVVIDRFFADGDVGRVEKLITTSGTRLMQTGTTGSADGDIIVGYSGTQVIKGLAGDDILIGKGGKDRITGGAGADRFDYDDLSDSGTTSTTMDTIYDFVHAVDKIDLFDIDADVLTTGNQAFNFVGAAAYSGTASELRYQYIGSNTMLGLDVNGDSVDDFNILLAGNIAFSAGDFIM